MSAENQSDVENNQNDREGRLDFFESLFDKAKPMSTTKGTPKTWNVSIKNENDDQDLEVYLLPHKAFLYNVNNTRIIASKEMWESDHSTVLDPVVNEEDIEGFLLNNPSYGDKTTAELSEELKRPRYLKEPILISEDGVVWNGNRRLAIIRSLLKSNYEPRFERVPVCRLPHLDDDELKSLEGRLQVKKTYKQEYGTIEVRLRIRQARENDDSWDKIRDEFGKRWSVSALENMLYELRFIDSYLNRLGRRKDYPYIYNKGGGAKKKGGIEIFILAAADEKNIRKDFLPEEGEQNPTEYNKRITGWYQQLSLPNVSHDTIREFNKIMGNKQAREEYFASDETYQNFDDFTGTMVDGPQGKQIEKAFSTPVLKDANDNRIMTFPYVMNEARDPKKYAKNALKTLRMINLELIPKNNSVFKKTMDDIKKTIDTIISSENYKSE